MPVEVVVPNLVGGVSQQPPKLRRPGKVESAENVWLDPARGAVRRPPSFLSAVTHSGSAPSDRRLVPIDLNGEVYFALVGEEEIVVWDDEGNQIPVVSPVGRTDVDLRSLDRQPYGVDYLGGPLEVSQTWSVTDPLDGTLSYAPVGSTSLDGPYAPAEETDFLQAVVNNGRTLTIERELDPRPPTKRGHRIEMFVRSDPGAVWTPPDDVELTLVMRDELDALDIIQVRFDWDGAAWSVGSADAEVDASVLDVGGLYWRLRADVTPNSQYKELSKYSMVIQATPDVVNNRELDWWGFRDSELDPAAAALDSQEDLAAITVQDFTFLLNKRKRVAMRGDRSTEELTSTFYVGDDPAFVDVRGFSSSTFTVRWQTSADAAAQEVSHSTGAGTPDSEALATALETAINAAAATTITALAAGSTLLLDPGAGETFLILEVRDTQGNTLLELVWQEVDSISDLPLTAPDGFVVRITGSPGSALDDHFVRFVRQSDASDVAEALEAGEGVWEETVSPGTQLGLESLTLPFQLVRRFDDAFGTITGTAFGPYFELAPVDWVDREVGDEDTNPDPAFVGELLSAIAFHRNRLALSSVEQVNLSEIGSYFNYFLTTTTALVDSDPIEVAASHTERSDVRQLLSKDDALLVFSDETTFTVSSGSQALTPQTATVRPVIRGTIDRACAPVLYQSGAIVAGQADPYAELRTVFQRDVDLWDDVTLTQEVPSYLDARVRELVPASRVGVLIARLEGSGLRVWFSLRDGEGNTVQAAWASWSLADYDSVAGIGLVDADLWLLLRLSDEEHLVRLPLDPAYVEDGEDWAAYLDSRCTPDSAVYDGGDDETTVTLPRQVLAGDQVLNLATGDVLQEVSRTSTTIVVDGDWSAATLVVGAACPMSLVLTPPYPKLPSQLGGLSARRGRFQVAILRVDVEDTNYLRAVVDSRGRAQRFGDFQAAEDVLSEVTLDDGVLSVWVGASPDDDLRVELLTVGPLPARVVSAAWTGEFWSGTGLLGTA